MNRKRHICFICHRLITGTPVYISKDAAHPEGLWRHIRCNPGSKRWMESNHGKSSEYFDYFPIVEETTAEEDPEEPTEET